MSTTARAQYIGGPSRLREAGGGAGPAWRLVAHIPQFFARYPVQAEIAAIAARQHGVITVAELHRCGLGSSGIRDWTHAGRLHRIHRGVYAVGHRGLSLEGEWIAAVLACGTRAALSHRSAAMLWRMLEPRPAVIHVTVPGAGGRSRRTGLRLHRSVTLLPHETTSHRAIRVTGPARTLADLRRGPKSTYRKAVRQAEFLRLLIGDALDADGTRSGLEADFLAFCGRQGLPRPEVNVKLGPFTVDFLWRAARVVVETDSFHTHGGAVAFQDDRARDLWLKANGCEVVRITDRMLRADPDAVAQSLRAILLAASRPGAGSRLARNCG